MGTCRISSVKSQKKSWNISTALASAVLEWLLMCMLFINAIFSYLITKFACHWELQTPCLLCSRLDHILGNKKLKYYWDLICRNHKLEISSLVFCHAHNNLVDVHGMCESCLFSFATINKSNAETYRLLVGKLGEDSSFGLDQALLLDGQSSITRLCSCCSEPWIPRSYYQKLMQATSIGSWAADIDVSISGTIKRDYSNLKECKRAASVRSTHEKSSRLYPLSHVGYTKLKINSDTESEALFSDDDGANAVDDDGANAVICENLSVGCMQPEPCIITVADDSVSEKLIDPVSSLEPSTLVSQLISDFIKSHNVAAIPPTDPTGADLDELSWQQADCKEENAAVPELICLDEALPAPISRDIPIEVSKANELIFVDDVPQASDAEKTQSEASKGSEITSRDHVPPSSDRKENPVEISEDSKLISLADFLPSSLSGAETPTQGLRESCVARKEEASQTSVVGREEICKAESQPAIRTEAVSEINSISGDNNQQVTNLLDLSEAYKLAIGNRGRQLSGVLAEQWIGKDSSKLSEDLKVLFSQLSATRDQSMNDVSPRVPISPGIPISPRVPISPKLSLISDELKTSDVSSTIGMQNLPKKITLERNESSLSLDGSIVSEIEGESEVDRLKRQVDHDKKLLSALYKELEEERNASTIAANQTMAMITRLQEEKATIHMEALQYLRMMEEQSEYDMEALQKTNDLLTDKEKEIQDLEMELEFYRNKYPNESPFEGMMGPIYETKATGTRADQLEAGCVEDSTSINKISVTEKLDACQKAAGTNMSLGDKDIGTVNSSLLEFEDERSYILQSVKKLERKLYLFSNNGLSLGLTNGEDSGNGDKRNELQGLNSKVGVELDCGAEENESSTTDGGREPVQRDVSSIEKSGNDNAEIFYSGESSPMPPREVDLDSIVNEVSDLSARLEALEADRNFLEHSINSMRYGNEGLQFILDIAYILKDLRKIGLQRREQIAS